MSCVILWLSWVGLWLGVLEWVILGGGCVGADGFQALHCSRFNWVAFAVCWRVCFS